MIGTPLPFTNCPTRRRDALFPDSWGQTITNDGGISVPVNTPVARTDYAVNAGSQQADQYSGGPPAGSDALPLTSAVLALQSGYFGTRTLTNLQSYNGVSFEQSTIRKDDITDGLSCTLLVGEKYLGLNCYGTGADGADNENEYVGYDNDVSAMPTCAKKDRWGDADEFAFGSAHAAAANFLLCDGSVIGINYSVDLTTFKYLGSRNDGQPVDMSKLGL